MRFIDIEKDYPKLCDMWSEWGWSHVPKESLPKIGVMNDVAAGFLYRTDSSIALIEFVVSTKKADKETRKNSINAVLQSLTFIAEQEGFENIITMVKSLSLIKKYKDIGFQVTDLNTTILTRELCQ